MFRCVLRPPFVTIRSYLSSEHNNRIGDLAINPHSILYRVYKARSLFNCLTALVACLWTMVSQKTWTVIFEYSLIHIARDFKMFVNCLKLNGTLRRKSTGQEISSVVCDVDQAVNVIVELLFRSPCTSKPDRSVC